MKVADLIQRMKANAAQGGTLLSFTPRQRRLAARHLRVVAERRAK